MAESHVAKSIDKDRLDNSATIWLMSSRVGFTLNTGGLCNLWQLHRFVSATQFSNYKLSTVFLLTMIQQHRYKQMYKATTSRIPFRTIQALAQIVGLGWFEDVRRHELVQEIIASLSQGQSEITFGALEIRRGHVQASLKIIQDRLS
ncbi:hypothetical protein WN51_01422 [Melipona quadrifasciata]|uniref:Uncharacterized protein n=1 Tax=Melipona quadrifasciata TaxID=166423 RepID=A0A0N0U4S1_9HYME|nr:hypothetical protein WN51_01422 [Melipona quadrifasciata]